MFVLLLEIAVAVGVAGGMVYWIVRPVQKRERDSRNAAAGGHPRGSDSGGGHGHSRGSGGSGDSRSESAGGAGE